MCHKPLIYFITIFLLVNLAYSATVSEPYWFAKTGTDYFYAWGNSPAGTWKGSFQTFMLNDTYQLDYVKFQIGTCSGTRLNLTLRIMNDTLEQNKELAFRSKQSSEINCSAGWNIYQFQNITLEGNKYYILYTNGTKDANEWYYFYYVNQTNVYPNGHYGFHISTALTNHTDKDQVLFFQLWKTTLDGIPPSLTLYTDIVNGSLTSDTSYTFKFNGSSTNNSNIYACSYYLNSNYADSKGSLNLSVNQNFTIISNNWEDWYNITINCFNENASTNISRMKYIDTKKATYNILSPLNQSSYYDNEDIPINFTLNDTNLFSFNFTVTKQNSPNVIYNIYQENLTLSYLTVYNISNSTSWDLGIYNFSLSIWENHNPLSDVTLFKEITPLISSNSIQYDDKGYFYKVTSDFTTTFKTYTSDNKQYFEFIPQDSKKVLHTYTLTSNYPLFYLPNSQYKGHFVIYPIRRYIDFVCDDTVNVKKVSDFEYTITTYCTNFKTTGNLNYQYVSGNFSLIETPELSTEYLASINQTLYEMNTNVSNIWEEIKMIGLYFIVISLTYFMLKTAWGNWGLATMLGGISMFPLLYIMTQVTSDVLGIGFGFWILFNLMFPTVWRRIIK